MPPVEVVCFDLDDTLCVHGLSDREFHRRAFDRAGADPPFTPAQLRAVDDERVGPSGTLSEFFTNLYRAAARRVDDDARPDDALLVEAGRHASDVADESGVRLRPGAERALGAATERYRVALVTNGRPVTQHSKLDDLGIADRFDRTLCCHPETGHPPKPDPAPFETVASWFGVPPEHCVVVGDSHAADVTGAHRVGARSVWTPVDRSHENPPADPEPAPTRRTTDLGQVPALVQSLDGE